MGYGTPPWWPKARVRPGPKVRPVAERFWSHVAIGADCWEWAGARTVLGYGVAVAEHRRTTKAHRLAWELVIGPILDGLYVCHHCDNPPCVRPDHLFLGTQGDNMRDARRKGRTATGDRNGSVTHPEKFGLSRGQALEIRARYTGRRGQAVELATEYGVDPRTIRRVVRGETFR